MIHENIIPPNRERRMYNMRIKKNTDYLNTWKRGIYSLRRRLLNPYIKTETAWATLGWWLFKYISLISLLRKLFLYRYPRLMNMVIQLGMVNGIHKW